MADVDEPIVDNPDTAYEQSDWPVATIGLVLAAVFIILVISPFVMMAAFPTTPADVSRALTVEPPQPRLQTDPSEDLVQFRAQEEKRLNGYYWIDEKNGVVHIPIGQAMKEVAAEGIDGFPGGKR